MADAPAWFGKFWRYGLTAGTAAVVDIGGFVVLVALAVPLVPAAIASFVAAAVVNYLLTARFVFGQQASRRAFVRFFAAALVGLAINVGVTVLAATQLGLPPRLAKIAGVGVAFCFNFALNALLVFRREVG